jgi:D-alanine-D-alanine ligase
MTLRVLHLVGSAVNDFYCDLSRLYARDCLESTADPARYEFLIAYVTPDLRWRFPHDLSGDAISAALPMSLADAIPRLIALDVDLMVPQMFCVPGMTSYRALFELLRIPYLGNTSDVMALASNKAKTKAIVAAAGVTVPDGQLLRPGEPATVIPPAVVKPADADNSLGVTLVRRRADYGVALDAAFAHSDQALVETFIELGREVRCGIVVRDDQLVCLPLEEYRIDRTTAIRAHDDKVRRNDDGELGFVAKDDSRSWTVASNDPVTQRVWEQARMCHEALGCRHYSLFDFRIDPNGQPWFLEAGLYCSFARSSVIATMARGAGTEIDELFRLAIDEVLMPSPPTLASDRGRPPRGLLLPLDGRSVRSRRNDSEKEYT